MCVCVCVCVCVSADDLFSKLPKLMMYTKNEPVRYEVFCSSCQLVVVFQFCNEVFSCMCRLSMQDKGLNTN